MRQRTPCVYILASRFNGVIYTGVTSNIIQRVWLHKQKLADGFTNQYGVDRLVWFEIHENMYAAIVREKQIKKWKRAWKVEMIEKSNPKWRDLYDEIR